MTKKHTGRCACGAIEFAFDTEPSFIASCHCLDCRRASGGTTATFFGVPQEDFTLLRGTPQAFGYVSEAGKKLQRNFCPECGARLFTSDLESFPGLVFVMLGSLDRPEGIAPRLEMFVKRRLPWLKPLDVPQHAGMPG
jgi:hypothetical protein